MQLAPYNYYVTSGSKPLLCEIDSSGFVYFPDACTIKHRTSYGGTFIKLVEEREPTLNNVPIYSNDQIDDIVDNHIFLDNGTSTYRVWEDRANKYLREMRDRYEKELAFWQRYGVNKNLELTDQRTQLPTGIPATVAPRGVES